MSLGRNLDVNGNTALNDIVHVGEMFFCGLEPNLQLNPFKNQAGSSGHCRGSEISFATWVLCGNPIIAFQPINLSSFMNTKFILKKMRFNKTISVGEAAVLGEQLKYGFALNSPFCQMIGMLQKYYCKHFENKTQSSRFI